MIALLYPKDDFAASDIALKLKTLSYDRSEIVTKHRYSDYRIPTNITGAILIMNESRLLDSSTLSSVHQLNRMKIPVRAIFPIKSSLPNCDVIPHTYNPDSLEHIRQTAWHSLYIGAEPIELSALVAVALLIQLINSSKK